jgi:hypothetical protein
VEFSLKVCNHQVGDVSLKHRVGVLADSESEERRQTVLPTVSESDCQSETGTKSVLPTQPFSERIACQFFALKYENSTE